ncbi:PREDICTED: NADH dehydrogenase [ubiquinone] complex I, assembly factor 7 isoform X2 [Elephantulus edwardii]|uniref:NADH dehydrogenase [ubiquinone] complex I, assembly factor 7 isoform X2 n=1 Tax=Elephantulus edwardii TaxID=28737 RepID=UPI0003F05F00|nr:PREDICTED: NADH dehydrogenase [ubiquinone] complex I, assembly factor 7 isoform X2 [Elephantulus edwardii]
MSVLCRAGAWSLCATARAVIPCLCNGKYFSSGRETAENSAVTPMLRHLMYKIKSTGPITVAEYMKEVLTNPAKLLGIWFISEWMSAGKNSTFQLVELGPGRGTLTGDILRVFSQLGSVLKNSDISIHLVEKTPQGWREVLIDIDPQVSDKLRFVLAPCATPAETFIQHDETRDHVEVCPDAGVIIQELSQRIALTGGAALIADYGHDGTKTDTFRGFCGHKLHDVLIAPGTADLTADVDFSYLRRMAQEKVASLGPIKQQTFLKNMGIDVRLKVLLGNSDKPSTRQQLLQGYDMLMNPKKMGERFHFFALVPHQRLPDGSHQVNERQSRKQKPSPAPVAGFDELVWR